MLRCLLLAWGLAVFPAFADTRADDIAISIAHPMSGLAFTHHELDHPKDPQVVAQLLQAERPTIRTFAVNRESLSVILKNCSSHDVRLWTEGSRWGYDNVGFTFTLNSGQKISIRRNKQLNWKANAPLFYLLHSQEEVVLKEDDLLNQNLWNWTPDELLAITKTNTSPDAINGSTVTITPVYSVQESPEDTGDKQSPVWTGTIQGNGVKFKLDLSS